MADGQLAELSSTSTPLWSGAPTVESRSRPRAWRRSWLTFGRRCSRAIANAEYVLEGNAGEFLAVRSLDSSRVLVVAYREVDRHGGLQAETTDSEFEADDVIVRYRGDEVIGLTILHASRRSRASGK